MFGFRNLQTLFLSVCLLSGATTLAWAQTQEQPNAAKPVTLKTQVDYICPNALPVAIPSYRGDRYEARVPDTLDIAERAKLAIRGLTGPLDPEDGYALYWNVNGRHPLVRIGAKMTVAFRSAKAAPLSRSERRRYILRGYRLDRSIGYNERQETGRHFGSIPRET